MTDKTQEALKLALEAFDAKGDAWIVLERRAKAAIREALAEQPAQQPEQEPVAWVKAVTHWLSAMPKIALAKSHEHGAKPVFLAPQPAQQLRQWQGLTSKEVEEIYENYPAKTSAMERVEVVLREKNGGRV